MVAGRFTSAAEKFTKAFDIYVSQAGDSFLIPEESAVLGESYSSHSSSRKNNTATMEAFGDPSADDDIKGSAGPLPSPSSVGAFRRSDDHTPSEGAAGGIDKDPAFNDVSIPSNRLRSSRNGSLLELSPTTLPLPTGKATITKSRSFTADSALRRSKALSSLPSVSVDMGRSAVRADNTIRYYTFFFALDSTPLFYLISTLLKLHLFSIFSFILSPMLVLPTFFSLFHGVPMIE